jgi:DNA-binding response OmpR family regulator
LVDYLKPEGFAVKTVHDGNQGVKKALSGDFDLIVLDVMLPGISGFDVLTRIRTKLNVPVLMLTARGDDVDKIVGLELGADDYISKPFNPRKLLARIRANLRRARQDLDENQTPQKPKMLVVGDIEMNLGTRTIHKSGKPISLTAVEYNLLEVLLRSAGQVVLREELIKAVLGRELNPFDRSIDVHVSNLRKKIGHKIGKHDRIVTIRSVGYLYSLGEEE